MVGFPNPCIYEYVFIVLSVIDFRVSNNFISTLKTGFHHFLKPGIADLRSDIDLDPLQITRFLSFSLEAFRVWVSC